MNTSNDNTSWRWWATIGGCLALLIAPVALIIAVAGDDGSAEREASPRADEFEDPGMAHIHGLGLNPANGELLAATHFGVFVVDQGQARRVGPAQDTMGLTVVGPDTLLASGHPDFAVDDEPLLGLIRSGDGGQTWDTVSRRGTSDFHALAAAHGQVFAYDATAGQFLSSTDGRDWTVRSALELHDFAVDPAGPDRLVATSDGTMLVSNDGGRAWEPMSAPQLAVVAWPEPGMLYGVGTEGTVHVSADAGARWAAVGDVGSEPQAITVGSDGAVYVAVSDVGIVRSADGGRSFEPVYRLR